jgi:hypothetical protein
MATSNSTGKSSTLIILISSILWGSGSIAAEPQVDRRVAAKIAKEKGELKPTEVLKWKIDPKDIPKDWLKIDNKYFSVSYPKCFNLQGEEGEDDPKIAPSILFNRGKDCPSYVSEYGDLNWLVISYYPTAEITSVDKASTADYSLLRQKAIVNGYDAILFAGLMDHLDESNNRFESKLRWQIFTICKGKTFRFGTMLPPGKSTMTLVEKNNYDFPEDFKKVVSTFKCK